MPVEQMEWSEIRGSEAAGRTANKIRQVVDVDRITPNPAKPLISLGLGDPSIGGNLDTDPAVTEAVVAQLKSMRSNGYPPSSGLLKAKAAIVSRYSHPDAPLAVRDITMASGCSGALDLAFKVLADPGSTVLLPRPGFTVYETICKAIGINVHYYALLPGRQWEIDLEALAAFLRSTEMKIAAWLINNPSNPCGSVYSREHLMDCVALADRFKLPIIADEIYEGMVFSGQTFHPIRLLSKTVPVLTVSGLSKRWLVPGWRLGWIILHDPLRLMDGVRAGLINLSGTILGPNSVVQAALPDIFTRTPESFYSRTMQILQENAEIARECLEGIPGITFLRPQGSMYAMIGIDVARLNGIANDRQFTELLHAEESVVCLPGEIFGMPNYFRIVYCIPGDLVREACSRIRSFCLAHLKA
jgi:tyrosine aminotransferase